MKTTDQKQTRTFTEEIEVMGSQLVSRVKDLFEQGNVKQLRIKKSNGDVLLETPLTVGVFAGGAVALAAPWLAIIGAIAGFATRLRLEIVREAAVDEAPVAASEDEFASFADTDSETSATSARSDAATAQSRPAASKRKSAATKPPAETPEQGDDARPAGKAKPAAKVKTAAKTKTGAKAKAAPKRKTAAKSKTDAE